MRTGHITTTLTVFTLPLPILQGYFEIARRSALIIASIMAELTLPSAPHLYPAPSQATLASHFVGKQIKDVQAPAAIIDAAIVRRNCDALSNAINRLGVGFRAHVKTHKVLYWPSTLH